MARAHALSFDRGSLRLEAPATARVPPYFVWDARVGAWRTAAINHLRVCEDAAAYRLTLSDRAARFFPAPALRPALPPLRRDQQAAIEAWERAGGRGVVVKPTGTGKTEIALAIIARQQAPALVVAPLRDLMYQWQRRIKHGLGFDAGVLGDGRQEVWPITVTTYDSAWIHMKDIGNRYRLIVYDEAHHLPGPTQHESALDCLAPLRLGLSATPGRADGRDAMLADLIGPVVYEEDLAQARGRTVADYLIVRVPIYLTEEEQAEFDELSRSIRQYVAARQREEGTFDWREIARRSRADPQAREILRCWRRKLAIVHRSAEKLRVLEDVFRLHPDEPCVVFTASNRMALDVSARFLIPALTAHSDKPQRRLGRAGREGGRRARRREGGPRGRAAPGPAPPEIRRPHRPTLRGRPPGDPRRRPRAAPGEDGCLPPRSASITGTGEAARSLLTGWRTRRCPPSSRRSPSIASGSARRAVGSGTPRAGPWTGSGPTASSRW
ncbi:MAG: DEAD/DEAH box helicase [Candidatus Rokubacteria bacterium]|nr:DEAD/DEAH box helicase [Candidatus Rokubacteria bacterium]